MRARSVLGALAMVAAVLVGGEPASGQLPGDGAQVRVKSNFYEPFEVRIEPGQKVTWLFDESGHTVTADDRRFDFDPSRTVASGETREWTFLADEVVGYYCRVHGFPGGGMWGRVIVGDASVPTPVPTPSPTPPPTRHVPSEYPSISSAAKDAAPDTVIEVAPGTYTDGNIRLVQPGIVVRGTGTSPADVVLQGTGRNNAFVVSARDVLIENLTVRDYRSNGIFVYDAPGVEIRDVVAVDNALAGISLSGATRGVVSDVVARGSGEAGIVARGCKDCDLVIERVEATGNVYGYAGINAGAVVVRDSVFRGNAAGVLLASRLDDRNPPQLGTHLVGNTIEDNDAADVPRRGFTETLDAPAGTGVWVAGGFYDVVQDNTITGHDRYGVVLTHLGVPSFGSRVLDNVVDGARADLAWDGVGIDVCFARNTSPDELVGEPQDIQGLYPCDGSVTLGVPYPTVDAEVFGAATRHVWCPAAGPEACAVLDDL